MIVPTKYEDIKKNYLTIGKEILLLSKKKINVYELYKKLLNNRTDEFELSFNRYLLTLDFLYSLELIDMNKNEVYAI